VDFVVSARKYRPQVFDTVVGQSSVTDTLSHAIASGQLAQAYLFCGPRGVGKTTCARIFAKEINKKNAESAADYAFNIFELDAASNNSVEDIRQLIDQVRIAPQEGKYKVYIIDEVHMLSQAAFNAFLKTLEEPPAHAIFILATTEKHKIIPTILSRCQVFDFQRISVKDMALHLRGIAEKENVQAEDEALHLIAEKADGGLRDALSLFDQMASACQGKITYTATIARLHVLDYNYYFKTLELANAEDISALFLLLEEIIAKGFDGHQFLSGLAQHLRNLLLAKDSKTLALISVSESVLDTYKKQAEMFAVPFIFHALDELSQADVQYKTSKNQRLLLELALLKLASIGQYLEKKKS
jgi:DNA polymerase-3 subunit gamma/tau